MTAALGLALAFCMTAQEQNSTKPTQAQVAELLRAVADAYDENRSKFPHGSIEFDYQDGYAKDSDAARNGELRDACVAKGSFAFEGRNARYTREFSNEAMVAATVWNGPTLGGSSRLESCRLLTNGKSTLSELITPAREGNEPVRGLIISPGAEAFFRDMMIPLDLGCPDALRSDLAQDLRAALDGTKGKASLIAVDENAVIDGIHAIQIELRLKNGTRTYWVDLEHGAIPIRAYGVATGGNTFDRHYGDIQPVTGRGWLPLTQTLFHGSGRVKRLVVKQTAFERAPAQDVFQMVLDQPRTVVDTGEGRVHAARSVYDLNNLPKASSAKLNPVNTQLPRGQAFALAGEREPWRFPYFTCIAIAFLLGIGLVVWRKSH